MHATIRSLSEQSPLFHALIDAAPDAGVIITDPHENHRLVDLNDTATVLLGVSTGATADVWAAGDSGHWVPEASGRFRGVLQPSATRTFSLSLILHPFVHQKKEWAVGVVRPIHTIEAAEYAGDSNTHNRQGFLFTLDTAIERAGASTNNRNLVDWLRTIILKTNDNTNIAEKPIRFELTIFPQGRQTENPAHVLGVARHVNEYQRRMERHEYMCFHCEIFKYTSDFICSIDVDHDYHFRFFEVNPAFEHALCAKQNQILGQSANHVLPEETAEVLHETYRRCLDSGTPVTKQLILDLPNTGRRTLDWRMFPSRDTEGRIHRLKGIARDITEEVQREKDLQRQISFQQALLNGLYDSGGALLVIENGKVVYIGDDELANQLGVSPQVVADGIYFVDLIHPDDRPRAMDIHRRRLAGEPAPTTYEIGVLLAGGERREYELGVAMIPNSEPPRTVVVGRDITARKQAEAALCQREEEFRTLVEHTPDVIVRYDRECRRLYVNPSWERVNRIPAAEVIGKSPVELSGTIKPMAEEFQAALQKVITSGEPTTIDLTWEDEAGALVCFALSAIPEFDPAGEVSSVLTVARDLSERKQMENDLAAREREFRTLAENAPDNIVRYDRQGRLVYANQRLRHTLGLTIEELRGKTPLEHVSTRAIDWPEMRDYQAQLQTVLETGQPAEMELPIHRPSGCNRTHFVRFVAEHDEQGELVGVLAIGRDVTELDEYRQRIHHLAFYDAMTGLPNRALFTDRFVQQLTEARWHDQIVGLMLLDIDRFKTVNDSIGHDAGDQLLIEAARRLTATMRSYDTIARLGGDEFAILLPEVRTASDLGTIAGKILAAMAQPFAIGKGEIYVSASIGIALFPQDSEEAGELFKYADSALYHAKAQGRNNYQFYAAELTAHARERVWIETNLRRAMQHNELELFYQPQLDLADGTVRSAEALIRWRSPEMGLVPPDRFIGVAEDTGLIVEVGAWVIRQACRAAAAWNRGRATPFKVAVNVSTRQFQGNDLVETVGAILAETGCRPQWLELELTESLLLADYPEVRDALKTFHAMGITLAIDDFGTGYSALGYLNRFPIDKLKIDRSFNRHIAENAENANLVKAIIALAASLGLGLVAEGVEHLRQEVLLRAWGCPMAQGYLYGRPMPQSDFENKFGLRAPNRDR